MRKPFHLLVFVLALALAYATAQTSGSSPSSQTTPSQPSQDQTQKPETQSGSSATATATSSTDVQGQIQTALKNDPTLSNANITVSVTDDAVELTGTVASGDEKRAAKKIAKSYAGTRKVKDSLTVSGESKKSPPGTMGFVSAGAYSQSQSSQSGTAGSANGTPQSTSPSTSQSPPTPNEPANARPLLAEARLRHPQLLTNLLVANCRLHNRGRRRRHPDAGSERSAEGAYSEQ